MGIVLNVLVFGLSFLALVECGPREETKACHTCNWELTVKTKDNYESGTDGDGYIVIVYEDNSNVQHKLQTSENDLYWGATQTFTFDGNPDKSSMKVFKYMVAVPLSYDDWQPDWLELRNKNNPDQVTGRCTVNGTLWISRKKAVCCRPYSAEGLECGVYWNFAG